ACRKRHGLLKLLSVTLFLESVVEHDGKPPVIIARELAHHHRGGFCSRLPVNVMRVITPQILSYRIEIGTGSARRHFFLSLRERHQMIEIINRLRIRVDNHLATGIYKATSLHQTERKAAAHAEPSPRV